MHVASNGTYGDRRVHAELTLGRGIGVDHGQVELLMRRAGIKGLPGKSAVGRSTRRPPPPTSSTGTSSAPHRTRSAMGHRYHRAPPRGQSVLLRGAGLSISSSGRLVDRLHPGRDVGVQRIGERIEMAIQNRRSHPGTMVHSAHGVQFISGAFTRRAQESGLVATIGSIADCFDNAVIESF